MNNYGYFPTYTTMLPLYQTVLGNYGIGGTGTQDSSSKSSRNKWYDNQNRFSDQQSSSDKEKANKGTTLGKEFTGGDGRDGFGGGTTSSSKGNDAGPSTNVSCEKETGRSKMTSKLWMRLCLALVRWD